MKHVLFIFKMILPCVITISVTHTSNAQEQSLDDIVSKISAAAKTAITSQYQMHDKTGDFQFVDAEIKSIHSFNDYSYGSLLDRFEKRMNSVQAYLDDYSNQMWPDDRSRLKKQIPIMLNYAKDNMTKIAGYSAVVDFIGVTKFKEKKEVNAVLVFDADGSYVSGKKQNHGDVLLTRLMGEEKVDMTDRGEIKDKLTPVMYEEIRAELQKQKNPLFAPAEYWISEIIHNIVKDRNYEQQCCFRFRKTNLEDSSVDTGEFRLYYWELFSLGANSPTKTLYVIDGRYEKDKDHIWFSYKDAEVIVYELVHDLGVRRSFSPGNFQDVDYGALLPLMLTTATAKKIIHRLNSSPDSYTWIDENTIDMTVPIVLGGPYRFTREH